MPRAEVYRKSHSRIEGGRFVTYAKGEELDATDRELKAFSDRLRLKGDDNQKKPGTPSGGAGDGGGDDESEDNHALSNALQELVAAAELARATEDVQQLRELAFRLNVDVSNRWGAERTRETILEALKERGLPDEGGEQIEQPEG